MNVGELIQELQKLDPNLIVMVNGGEATEVNVKNFCETKYVRIFSRRIVDFVSPMYGEKTTGNPHFSEESNTVPQDMGRYDPYTDQFIKE